MRRAVQILGWTLIWSGLFIFGYLGWQLFATDLINAGVQTEARAELETFFDQVRSQPSDPAEVITAPGRPPVELFGEEIPPSGTEFARLLVPKVGLDSVLFEGVDRETLRNGPGHIPGTPLPGQPGNAVVSGHRTTYGRPFFDFDLLEPGDRIMVETAVGTHVYEVRETLIVKPTDVWVTDDKSGGWLTLTTCNPKFSARERLVITAEMVSGPNFQYVEYVRGL